MIKQFVREEIHNLISQNDYDDDEGDIKPSKIKNNTNIITKRTNKDILRDCGKDISNLKPQQIQMHLRSKFHLNNI
jgi:hypothetical protein